MQKLLSSLILLFATMLHASAATGSWRLYPSYNNIDEISPAGTICFATASGSLFSYNTTSGETVTYDKTNSLSDANIAHIRWSPMAKRLIIAYDNSNIDLLATNGSVVNVSDLYSKTTSKDKTINHIFLDGNYAYLSIGFGVLKLDMRKGVVADTYQLDFGVNYTYIKDGYLYAVSKTNGTYRGKLTDNLLDKSTWMYSGNYIALSEDRLNVNDPTTGLWWTKNDNGRLTYYSIDSDGNREYKTEGVLPDGPASNNFYRLYMHGGKLYGVAGQWSQELDGKYPGEVHVWDGTQWSEFEQPTREILGHRNEDWLCMDFDPKKEGHVMIGAKSGLYEFQDGQFVKCYNTDNSPIESSINSMNYAIVGSVKYDSNGNLWLLNRQGEYPIKQITKEGEWKCFPHSEITDKWNLTSLLISPTNGLMWFVNDHWGSTGLYAYDYANDNIFQWNTTYVNEDGTAVSPNYLYTISEDNSGNIWMATSSGPLYLSPSDFQSGIFTQHKVPRNDGTNLADYLLTNVETRKIAFDGANRKWIATSNGVFLISEDCNTQIHHFTTDNSPMLSNLVKDIVIDKNSSTVYFATDKGLCSYESDATTPSDEMTKDNVYAYPNPVKPDFTGYITIVGLSYNADVKIVTSNGTLVNQGRSTGGSYKWDGRDLKGRRVASGVYMVEAATENGEKGTVCKIGIIR